MKKIIDKIIQIMITVIMAIMVIAVCWQVFTRFVLLNPSTVTEEALRYLLVWTTMVGGAYAYGNRKHLSINIISKKLSKKAGLVLDCVIQGIVIIFSILVMIMGGMTLSETADGMISAAMGISMQYVYFALIVGGILFIFYSCLFIKEDIQKIIDVKEEKK